jgi:hypothetical protein
MTQGAAMISDSSPEFVFRSEGECSICEARTHFSAKDPWFRDNLFCEICHSLPRERALMHVIQKFFPNWRDYSVHESSPVPRGASLKLMRNVNNYVATQYFPNFEFGVMHPSGSRNENLED